MPWNNSNNDKNPWGKNGQQSGPPDLDALLRKLKNKLFAALKNKGASPGSPKPAVGNLFKQSWFIGLIIGIVVIIWIISGIYIVSPAERAVVLRFGNYANTVGPGPHWVPVFIESANIVNVQQVSNYTYEANMLTKDENIVSVAVTVQYRINNARDYLFNVVRADESLQQATASALRQVVGHSTLDDILTTGREIAREQIAKQLQDLLNRYQSGLIATDVTLQSVKPPEEVTAAFDDVIKAREDQQSYINKANAYAYQVTAVAQGQIARILQEAQAYQQEVVLQAKAIIASYLALLPEYKRSPEVTRERLYLTTITSVLSKSSKIILDNPNGSNVIYLPLDRMLPASPLKLSPMVTEPTVAPDATVAPKTTNNTAAETDTDEQKIVSDRPTRGSY